MRGYLEQYNHIEFKMMRYIGLSPPLAGFYCGKLFKCDDKFLLPEIIQMLLSGLEYSEFIQELVGPAGYWRDPYNE